MITLREVAKRYRHFMKEPDKVIKLPKTKPGCPHCKFIEYTFHKEIKSNYEYWIVTEVFVYLHDGKAYCNYKDEQSHP